MILKGNNLKKIQIPYTWLFGFLGIIGLIYFINSRDRDKQHPQESIVCDAENTLDKQFVNSENKFSNSATQSSEESYSGNYSSKLDSKHQYGMSYVVESPTPGTRYHVKIKRKSKNSVHSALAINMDPISAGYKQSSTPTHIDKNGWETLELEFIIDDLTHVNKVSIFPYLINDKSVAYFDDLTITINPLTPYRDLNHTQLHLYLDHKALNKLNNKRNKALSEGLLVSADDDWVKAKLTEDDNYGVDVKLRLKGDWTDHLRGDYWSYRIKMPSDKTWNRMQTFSLQDPSTRSYLDEWIYHMALDKVDVITPRYGFVRLIQNDKKPVLYAYEEHFEKQIAEYRKRREGVILKLSDEYLWSQRMLNKQEENPDVFETSITNSDILPFGVKKTLNNPKLKEQFVHAQDLLNAFKERKAKAAEVFDMKLLAKYFAITDIFDGGHAFVWHNMRFYYNAITRKLEPIGFDGFTENGAFKVYNNLFFGEFKSGIANNNWSAFYNYIYKDPEFNKYYVPALNKYSGDLFINELLQEKAEEVTKYEKLISNYTAANYSLDKSKIRKRARLINKNIQPRDEISIKAYRDSKNSATIDVSNYHPIPIEIIGSSNDKEAINSNAIITLVNSNARNLPPQYTTIDVDASHRFIHYRLAGSDDIFYSTIRKWRHPENLISRYEPYQKPIIPFQEKDYSLTDNQLVIKSGKYILDSPLILPKGYTLILSEGTEIDLRNKSYLLVYGALRSIGHAESPITIASSDSSAQGVTVIQADKKSVLAYTTIENLNTLEENEWQLTGAITFYESDVDMVNVSIRHNHCEDALNIIRSEFNISKLNINHTFADGFDSDFCKGSLTDSYFHHTGNDAVDYSGSVVDISNLRLENIGDKGISAGEQATIKANNVYIDGAVIGIASKDLSSVTVTDLDMHNCIQGLAAYRKKPEFGGGIINVNSYTATNVERLTQNDDESRIFLPQKEN